MKQNGSAILRRVLGVTGTLAALAMIVGVIIVGRPAAIRANVIDIEWLPVAGAAVAVIVANFMRGLKLIVLLPGVRLSITRAWCVAALAQVATLFAPARAGELALPFILHHETGWDRTRGLGTLIAVRVLDLAALAVWSAIGVATVWGLDNPPALLAAGLLFVAAVVVPFCIAAVDRIARRFLAGRGGLFERLAFLIRTVAAALEEIGRAPLRLFLAIVYSLLTWLMIWLATILFLNAMGLDWPASRVLVGASSAALASIIPFSLIGGFGPIQAGWTAVFGALGFSVDTAAAAGVAVHLWTLILSAVNGLAAWLFISRVKARPEP